MWFWCTSQLYLERFCVHGVNVSDLIWAVRSLSIKHFHHCILHYNMQTKAAASLLSTAVLMMSTCCYRERARRQGEEGPACRIWSLFQSQCFSLAIPGSCRNTVADTELDLHSLQILRAHFLSDFFCSGSVADQWKYPILPIDLPKICDDQTFHCIYLFPRSQNICWAKLNLVPGRSLPAGPSLGHPAQNPANWTLFFKRSVTRVGGSWSENNFLPVMTLYSRVESRVVMIPMALMLPNMPYWARVCWDLIPHTLSAWNRALLLPRGLPVHQCSPPYTHTGQAFVIVVDICVVFRVGCQTRW